MHPADIKAAIEKAGSSQAAIARSLGVGTGGESLSRTAVFMVVRGISKSRRIATAISKVTGLAVGQLWPGKYPDLEALDRIVKAQVARNAGAAGGTPRPKRRTT